MRSPRQLNTSRAWNHVTNQLWIQQIIQKRPIQSGKVLQQRREREPMPDPSVTAIQSHHVRIKAATQIHHKSHSNKKTRKLPAKRQLERICADDLLQIQKRIPHVSRPTTTQEYFTSQSWLNRVEELTFTFAAYDKQENHFDHILVTHDRLEWPLQLPTLLMR